ncbi:MAG: hypothetical protein WBP26_00400 [Candidatus Saccharimonadales bacterium]
MIEHIPYVATAVGYSAGVVAEAYVQPAIARQRAAFTEAMGNTGERDPSVWSRLGSAALGPLAITGAAAAFLLASAWQPAEPVELPKAGIGVVVDRSGGTIQTEGEKSPYDTINQSLDTIVESGVPVRAVIAGAGEIAVGTTQDAINRQPFGDAPIAQGIANALSDARTGLEGMGQQYDPSVEAGVIVLTNGNSLGDPEQVIKAAGEAPILIANASIQPPSEAAESQFRQIAEATGGEYIAADSITPEKIQEFIQDVQPRVLVPEEKSNVAQRVVATGIAALLLLTTAWNRGRMPIAFTRNKKEI